MQEEYPKIKNGLTRLAYLLSQTTRSELGVVAADTLRLYSKDKKEFLIASQKALEQICGHTALTHQKNSHYKSYCYKSFKNILSR